MCKFCVSPSVVLLIMGSCPDVSPPVVDNSPTWDSAVSSTLFACHWISNIVPVPVLPSSTYSSLARAISTMFLSVRQDVHPDLSVGMRLNTPAQGSTTILCDREQPCEARCCSCAAQAFTLPSQSARFVFSRAKRGIVRIRDKVQPAYDLYSSENVRVTATGLKN